MWFGLRQHAREQLAGNLLIQQPFPVLAEYRMIPYRFIQLQPHEPSEQQVVLHPLRQHPVAAHRIDEPPCSRTVTSSQRGISGTPTVRDLWAHKNLGRIASGYSAARTALFLLRLGPQQLLGLGFRQSGRLRTGPFSMV